jgi:hypothetical protein
MPMTSARATDAHRKLADARTWAQAHLALLAAAFAHFNAEAEWPPLEQLQHEFERRATPLDVRAAAFEMPNPLGFVEQERVVLRVRALQLVPAAESLLEDWFQAVKLAYARWLNDPHSELTAADLRGLFADDTRRVRLTSELLLREEWPFGSGSGGAADDWRRELNSAVRVARDAASPGELLAARDAVEFPVPNAPAQTEQPRRRRLGQVWRLVGHNPLISAIIAGLVVLAASIVVTQSIGGDGGAARGPTALPQTGTRGTTTTGQGPGPARREQAGAGGARSYANPQALSGEGVKLTPMEYVRVSCKVYSPDPSSVVPDGYWYRLTSPPWNGRYYAPANSFWNGDVPGRKPYTHNTDKRVPDC